MILSKIKSHGLAAPVNKYRCGLVALRSSIFLLVLSAVLVAFPAHAVDWDWDLRCCLSKKQILNVFMISLNGVERPVAQLQLLTPKNRVHGYDAKVEAFYPPDYDVMYASGPVSALTYDAEWDKQRMRRLLVKTMYEGRYVVKVIGLRDGAYNLMFQPGGAPQVGPGARNSIFDASFYNVAIRAGEVHHYHFEGEFSDIYQGGIRRDSPNAFRPVRKK